MPSNKKKGKKWQRLRKTGDVLMHDARPTDIIIPVMGATGVGKSTFINSLRGDRTMGVGHDLNSCTRNLQYSILQVNRPSLHGRRIILVDTPGFDDTFSDDAEILRRISVWLADSYNSDMKLGGIIYLYNISQPRMLGSSRMNLEMFQKLCGTKAFSRVVMGTTYWDSITLEVGMQREKTLKTSFWEEILHEGAGIQRIEKRERDALATINNILQRFETAEKTKNAQAEVLRIQQEIVDMDKIIPMTEAGQELRYSLKQLLEMQSQMAEGIENDSKRAEVERKVAETRNQLNNLKISLGTRIMSFFGL